MKAIVLFVAIFSVSMSSFAMKHGVDCPLNDEGRSANKWEKILKKSQKTDPVRSKVKSIVRK